MSYPVEILQKCLILLVFLNPSRLNNLIIWLTKHELSEDSMDVIANIIINLSLKFTINTQYFGVFYSISLGIVKFILIILLWKGKVWAYPVTIILLIVFIMYQIYKYMLNPSIILVIHTSFDVIMIILTFVEYRRIRNFFI
ncbi:DUF2127 domain-containing protein [Clostridium felsineum]|uniref:DUF2127 domain-containing protein n=1 Tax=Clostridium felsineum TaxID=36839 RepID=UPI00214DB5F2|nr:DUF2127 domain-containing protein [Clostridium felsineum]MCR3758636.1 DUF2127 domain-containing protein [Clostridium felsineum]